MEAQTILPVRLAGARKQASAAPGISDVFQAILRERETRELAAPKAETGHEVERGAGRPTMARPRSDAAHETRHDDRYADPRDERPEAHDIQATERHGRPEESQPRTERPDRSAEPAPAEAGAQGHDAAPRTGDTPVETGLATDGAPEPAPPVGAANPALAGNPANAVTPFIQVAGGVVAQAQTVAAALEPASPKDAVSHAPRPAVTPAAAVTNPPAALGGAAATPAQTESETAAAPALAAAKATRSASPAAPAEAGIPLNAVHVKPPQAPGYRAGAATASTETVEGMGAPDKENQASTAAKIRPDLAGHKTGAPPLVKDPAVPGGQAGANQAAHANPAPAAPSLGNPGQRTPTASGAAADGLKTTAATGFAGQAPAGLTAIDPMQVATRAAGARPASTPGANRPVTPSEVVVNIQRAAARGEDRIRIRLHPAELGQVDVRLKVGADGIVRAIVQVDRPETLDFMQRDARGLERALQDAGLKTDSGSLSFNLRDNGHGGPRDGSGDAPAAGREQGDVNPPTAAEEAEIPAHNGWSNRALDIRV